MLRKRSVLLGPQTCQLDKTVLDLTRREPWGCSAVPVRSPPQGATLVKSQGVPPAPRCMAQWVHEATRCEGGAHGSPVTGGRVFRRVPHVSFPRAPTALCAVHRGPAPLLPGRQPDSDGSQCVVKTRVYWTRRPAVRAGVILPGPCPEPLAPRRGRGARTLHSASAERAAGARLHPEGWGTAGARPAAHTPRTRGAPAPRHLGAALPRPRPPPSVA